MADVEIVTTFDMHHAQIKSAGMNDVAEGIGSREP
jgi:hypothetical protein